MDYYSTINRNQILMYTVIVMNFKNSMLTEIKKIQMDTSV